MDLLFLSFGKDPADLKAGLRSYGRNPRLPQFLEDHKKREFYSFAEQALERLIPVGHLYRTNPHDNQNNIGLVFFDSETLQ